MQEKADGTSAQAFAKDEFQAFMRHFVDPLMQKTLSERYDKEKNAPHSDGAPSKFCQVYDDYKYKLKATYEQGQEFQGVESDELRWRACKDVPLSAYKPRDVPYFVSYDRGNMHSFWEGVGQKVHERQPGVPLLHLLIMPTHGHDLHQIVEHAIGATKGHVNRELGRARALNRRPSTSMCYKAVMDGSELYTKESWDRNLARLQNCLRIVAAPWDKQLTVEFKTVDRWGNEHVRTVTVMGTEGGYCPKQWS